MDGEHCQEILVPHILIVLKAHTGCRQGKEPKAQVPIEINQYEPRSGTANGSVIYCNCSRLPSRCVLNRPPRHQILFST